MSITITPTNISTSSNTLTLVEGTKSIVLKSNQMIITDNYVTSGTYVFKKGVVIPVVYFATNTASFTFNLSTGTSSPSVSQSLPVYFTQLAKVIADSSVTKSYRVGGCVSAVSATSIVGINEANYWLNSKAINSANYSYTDRAPTVRANGEIVPNTSNAYIKCTVSGTTATFTLTQTTNSLIVLSVVLS